MNTAILSLLFDKSIGRPIQIIAIILIFSINTKFILWLFYKICTEKFE